MTDHLSQQSWRVHDRFLELRSPWVTLLGEHLETEQGVLEYWRVEKANSAVILTIEDNQFVLPLPMYRPGIGRATLDFPGGRVPEGKLPDDVATSILQRELGVEAGTIVQLTSLSSAGWAVNSSFSNQRLYGFVAQLQSGAVQADCVRYPTIDAGVRDLLHTLACLQCRAVLLEWWRHQKT
ncbi:NUDIX hydrolase [Leptolyngbya sp. FACHB-36]|uniref:NUDIX hydrolase n=1 Tax=Leptolyngbya sp. FACHB-36 TaxID=2692808 RepID=UPI001680A320|nr:NUDIX hydrolase [Leptolyngbya sp. FACHB-36]MBD2021250.1 NUDIX hydrolase [Leptolyngbya sp. FACHB-36]